MLVRVYQRPPFHRFEYNAWRSSDSPAPAITDQRLNHLNKLRIVPAALFYWQHTYAA